MPPHLTSDDILVSPDQLANRGPSKRRNAMKSLKNLLSSFLSDDRGGEVLEYALIAGLIVVACIAVIGTVGTKVLARWNSLNSSM